MTIFNKKIGLFMFIFISLKFHYSHESVLRIWTSFFKHLAGKKKTACIYIQCIYSSSIYHKVGNENVTFDKLWYAAMVELLLHCTVTNYLQISSCCSWYNSNTSKHRQILLLHQDLTVFAGAAVAALHSYELFADLLLL